MPLDPIKFRTDDLAKWGVGIGMNLDAVDFDLNNWNFDQRLLALETATPPEAVGIDSFSFVGGNIMTIHMTDATTRGPFVIDVGWLPQGIWLPSTAYIKNHLIVSPVGPYAGNAYLVTWPHTSALAFDPEATDGLGHKLYGLLLPAAIPPVLANDLHIFVSGLMTNNQLLLTYGSVRPWTLPTNLLGSLFKGGTAAVASTVVSLFLDTTPIGTLTWGVGATVPTVAFTGRVDFDVGEYFIVKGPAVADTGLSDVALDFAGTRIS